MKTVESFVQSIDPALLAIAVVIMMVAFIIMMLIYIPRVEKLRELENDKKRYKAERDYAVEQWSVAMISGNRQKDKILEDLKNTEGRKNQFSKISKTMAEAYDKLKGQYGIDILKQELPVVTFHVSRAIPRAYVMDCDSEMVRKTINQDLAELIGRYVVDHELAKIICDTNRTRDTFDFDAEVRMVDPRTEKWYKDFSAFERAYKNVSE
jgi:hypothetical protein